MSNSAMAATAPSTPTISASPTAPTPADTEMHARVEQDATRIMAAIQPRTWSFTNNVTGLEVDVTCMPGCDLDHAKDVDTPTAPEDIYCITRGESIELPMIGPLCEGSGAEEFSILAWQIDVHPFSTKMAERLPHVNIEAIDDHWIEALDPDSLATVIGHLQKQVDSLRAAHTQLVRVRADYAAEQILSALRASEVTA
jgi:hypothetical protein